MWWPVIWNRLLLEEETRSRSFPNHSNFILSGISSNEATGDLEPTLAEEGDPESVTSWLFDFQPFGSIEQ